MAKNRNRLLEKKRGELEKGLIRWATKIAILQPEEQLVVEIRIVKGAHAITVGTFDEELKKLLPPDKKERGRLTTWKLDESDWGKLSKLPWTGSQVAVFSLLRACNNGPIYRPDVEAQGVEWIKTTSGFVQNFNKILLLASNCRVGEVDVAYYHLWQLWANPKKKGYYAIRKHQPYQEEVP